MDENYYFSRYDWFKSSLGPTFRRMANLEGWVMARSAVHMHQQAKFFLSKKQPLVL